LLNRPWKLVLALLLFIAIIAVGLFSLTGGFDCFHLPGTVVDGYASATAETWVDEDGDGVQDVGEAPLAGVIIQLAHEEATTDVNGQGTVGVFKPGCACRCWEGEVISVQAPPGYQATTPGEIELTGEGLIYQFGFQLEP